MSRQERDGEKGRYWQRTIQDAVRSGMSIRAFCRERRLRVGQFYWWRHRLSQRGPGQGDRPRVTRFAKGARRVLPW